MIEIAYNPPSDLVREASQIVDSLRDDPKGPLRGALIVRLEEIGKISPQAVLGVTRGDLFELMTSLLGGFIEESSPTMAIGFECKLRVLLEDLIGDSKNAALKLAAESAVWSYAEYWFACMHAEHGMTGEYMRIPAEVEKRQNFTQRRLLRALATVEEIRTLTRPRRFAMEI